MAYRFYVRGEGTSIHTLLATCGHQRLWRTKTSPLVSMHDLWDMYEGGGAYVYSP